jgi:ATP-dependent Clp protease protease subunit
MIHQPIAGTQGQVSDIEIHARRLIRVKERINKILAERTGQPLKRIASDTDRDNFMTAEEAKIYGIVDKIFEPSVRKTKKGTD